MADTGLTEEKRLAWAQEFFRVIPHSAQIGLRVVACEAGVVVAELPYSPAIVGNPLTGHIHGGAIMTLIDQTSGAAAVCSLPEPEAVATLDLRVDHMRAATPGETLIARAECYRVTRDIAFVRCVCYHADAADPVATSMSTFMRASSRHGSMVKGAV